MFGSHSTRVKHETGCLVPTVKLRWLILFIFVMHFAFRANLCFICKHSDIYSWLIVFLYTLFFSFFLFFFFSRPSLISFIIM